MKQMRHRNLNLLVAVAFLLAAVVNAYAFRIGSVSLAPADLLAYALPDGSLPEFCLSSEDENGGHHDRSKNCDFCRIIAMPGLTGGPSYTLGVPAFETSVAYAEPAYALISQRTVRNLRARSPPVTILS